MLSKAKNWLGSPRIKRVPKALDNMRWRLNYFTWDPRQCPGLGGLSTLSRRTLCSVMYVVGSSAGYGVAFFVLNRRERDDKSKARWNAGELW